MAILNDTTGTLMSCAWKNHNCKIGLIVGMLKDSKWFLVVVLTMMKQQKKKFLITLLEKNI